MWEDLLPFMMTSQFVPIYLYLWLRWDPFVGGVVFVALLTLFVHYFTSPPWPQQNYPPPPPPPPPPPFFFFSFYFFNFLLNWIQFAGLQWLCGSARDHYDRQTDGTIMADRRDHYGRQMGPLWPTDRTIMADRRDHYGRQTDGIIMADRQTGSLWPTDRRDHYGRQADGTIMADRQTGPLWPTVETIMADRRDHYGRQTGPLWPTDRRDHYGRQTDGTIMADRQTRLFMADRRGYYGRQTDATIIADRQTGLLWPTDEMRAVRVSWQRRRWRWVRRSVDQDTLRARSRHDQQSHHPKKLWRGRSKLDLPLQQSHGNSHAFCGVFI